MVKWISHRGESFDAPENTLAAFKLSLERKTDGMECDVHLTTDGKVIIAHDNFTSRMGDKIVNVEEVTYDELQEICVSAAYQKKYPNEKIPLLEEAFQYLGDGREFYIELKNSNPALVPAVKEVVEKANINPDQIVFIAFSENLISSIKKAMPQCKALWLNSLSRDYGLVKPEELVAKLEELGVDGVDGACHPHITAELVKAVHDAGKYFAVWTVDNPAHAEHLIKLGVDSITSNCAAMLQNW